MAMASAVRLVFLAAVHSYWVSLAGCEEQRCTCVVELPPTPEPNRGLLELLEKQLDRCGPEHQTCPACPRCTSMPSQGTLPVFPAGADAPSWIVALLIGIILGRLSHFVVPAIGKPGKNLTHGNEDEQGARQEQADHHTETAKYMDDVRCELPEETSEPIFPTYAGKLEAEMGPESRWRCPPAAAVVTEETDTNICRLEDDIEDEEKLGIIDAGDEEWIEVHDVIREHSAVTIFNHTDSTWYVSSKHPHFVRPLHGKRRHPLKQPHIRQQTWTQNQTSISRAMPSHQEDSFGPSWLTDEQGNPCASMVQGAGFAGDASSHIQRMLRRPHSAPSAAHGRADEHQIAPRWMQHHDSHQRCASEEPAHVSAPEFRSTDMPHTLVHDQLSQDGPGLRPDSGDRRMRKVRSASPPIFEDRSYED